MSWLKNSSIGASLGKLRSSTSPSKECDPSACYASFKKHWQQIHEIIEKTKAVGNMLKTDDDFLGVVNNLKKLVTLLQIELQSSHVNKPCLDYLLSQNLLDQLYSWSETTGRYGNTLKMQQMQLYEGLVNHSGAQLLIHEPFHKPLLKLLTSCINELFSVEVEKCLVVLLNQLCVSLIHQNELLDLFFFAGKPSSFIIFSLLLPFVHREGALGQQARDALLLCIGLSQRNNAVAEFIIRDSNFCPLLAAGLCGLYSELPRKLSDIPIDAPDWHRFTPDDINDMPELAQFMNSLEFCNAVVQVAHPIICDELIHLLYGAFLIPVMGPALLQSSEEDLAAATAYFNLFLRSLSEPGLLNLFVRFVLKDTYDDQRIIDSIVMRIKSKTRLCVVTLALLETLIELNCEDVMLELVLRHLVPCTHVMLSQRSRVSHIDPYCRSAEKFLSLAPVIPRADPVEGSLYGDYQAYLFDARTKISSCAMATSCWAYPYDGENPPYSGLPVRPEEGGTAQRQNINCIESEADHSLPSADDGSSGYESFALKEGGRECESGGECESPCGSGSGSGSGGDVLETCANTNNGSSNINCNDGSDNVNNNPIGNDTNNINGPDNISNDIGNNNSSNSNISNRDSNNCNNGNTTASCTTTTMTTPGDINRNYSTHGKPSSTCLLPFRKSPSVYMNIFNSTPCIGPFLDVLFAKLEDMLTHDLYVNLRLTGLVSRLAVYPQPLIHSFLLDHSLVFQPSIRSLFQVLGALKLKIESRLCEPNVNMYINDAQTFLLEREERLVNARKHALEAPASLPPISNRTISDPFDRSDGKRRSLSLAWSSVFKRQQNQPSTKEIINNFGTSRFAKEKERKKEAEIKNIVMCAVILDEWLKELAAITQEHTILRTSL